MVTRNSFAALAIFSVGALVGLTIHSAHARYTSMQNIKKFNRDDDEVAESFVTTPENGMVNGIPVEVEPLVPRHPNKVACGRYLKLVVMQVKNRVGCPVDNTANRLVIRRCLRNIMEEHGVRPSHINRYLPLGVELVLSPNDSEQMAQRVRGYRYSYLKRIIDTVDQVLFGLCIGETPEAQI